MAQQSGDTSRQPIDARADKDIDEHTVVGLAKRLTVERKLIVASNRGPLYFTEDDPPRLTAKRDNSRSSEVFGSLGDIPISWVSGAVGSADRKAAETLSGDDGLLRSEVLPAGWDVRFVSPPRRVHHKFYNVTCNPLLWFMLHRSWSPTFTPVIGDQEHDAWERGYRAVNEMFAASILQAAGDRPLALMSRDYQLMLVPGVVRVSRPEAVIHHSFETPWPWPADFEILPATWCTRILESLLAADVLSFPSRRDVNAFAACAGEFLGDRCNFSGEQSGSVVFEGHKVRLSVSGPTPRSKQFELVKDFAPTQRYINDLADPHYDHTFVTVDRAEPHKNIVRSIAAFGALLIQQPELVGKVRYLLYLTPGPAHISAYKRLSDEVRRAARRVNEKAGGMQPVRVVEENNFYRAVAALSIYDTLVSVPVVDGSSRTALDGPMVNSVNGGMILSETNAVADLYGQSISRAAFADVGALTKAMVAAVTESTEDRQRKSRELRNIVQSTPVDWSIQQAMADLLTVVSAG